MKITTYVTDAEGNKWPLICICLGELNRFCPVCNLNLELIKPDESPMIYPTYSDHGSVTGFYTQEV